MNAGLDAKMIPRDLEEDGAELVKNILLEGYDNENRIIKKRKV